MNARRAILISYASVWLAFPAAPGAWAAEELPATTPDGLELVKGTKVRAVYAKPGATLEPYTKVTWVDCYVSEADRILRKWAALLSNHLGTVRDATEGPEA